MLRLRILFLLVSIFASLSANAQENLALDKTYTLTPSPNYEHCTEAGDKQQLTDGKTTDLYFWTQQGTVGWQAADRVSITVDLGEIEPISGFAFHTAAGAAGVEWPCAIFVLISDDGKTYRLAGELVADTTALEGPLPQTYAIRWMKTKPVQTKGRFVQFLMLPTGIFAFCDEIQILRGDKTFLEKPAAEKIVTDIDVFCQRIRLNRVLKKRYLDDGQAIQQAIAASSLDAAKKEALKAELDAILASSDAAIQDLPERFKAILPLSQHFASLYQVQAKLWTALGVKPLTSEPALAIWAPLDRFAVPAQKAEKAPISVVAMQRETRAAAFNLYNATEAVRSVEFQLDGLAPYADVSVYQVDWTDTSQVIPVAAALTELKPQEGKYRVTVPSGLVRQIWLRVKPHVQTAQKQMIDGMIRFMEKEVENLSIRLIVYPLVFPERTQLLVGGWDYLDNGGSYNVNERNFDAFLAHMKSRHVNCPWASPALLSKYEVDAALNVTLDTKEFDRWIANWSDVAAAYAIFLGKGGWSSKMVDTYRGCKIGSPEFKTLVSNLAKAWAEQFRRKGIDCRKVHLLIYDEPNDGTPQGAVECLIAWRDAIKAGCPEFNIWVDPCYRTLKAENPVFQCADVLCPNRAAWLKTPAEFDAFYPQQVESGKTLHLYSCSGPARLLDPYAYYRLQAWDAARIGAKASFFWAMGDGSQVSSWEEYRLQRNAYTPIFIDPAAAEVTAAKQMEAIAESAQDFEYIQLLRAKIAQLAPQNPDRATELQKSLDALILSVLNAKDADKILWYELKDTTQADRARVQILDWLTE